MNKLGHIFDLIALLLAIASVRSLNGTTPHDAAELLLEFALHSDDRHLQSAPNAQVDTCHFKAVLLYALSQVRTEPLRGDTRGTLKEIAAFCRSCLHKDYRSAMLSARINHDLAKLNSSRRGNGNLLLPAFDGGGVVTAAVLNCVVEGAMQMLQGDYTRFQETIQVVEDQSQLSTRVQAGGSGVDFTKYFLAPETKIGEASQYYEPLVVPEPSYRESELYSICTPAVRATGLECFVRLCFMQHLLYSAKYNLIDGTLRRGAWMHRILNALPPRPPSCLWRCRPVYS